MEERKGGDMGVGGQGWGWGGRIGKDVGGERTPERGKKKCIIE